LCRYCALLLPWLTLAVAPPAARAEQRAYTIAPAPRWVTPLPVPDVPAPASQGAGQAHTVQNLLFELQMSVEAGGGAGSRAPRDAC
jgi:hypothetical protein